ncbi:MAG: transposase [Phormidium sp. GEM2.Bin31]|nr:MAG: transposase [Phormidium sp. GEM2.Bin31]
MKYNPDIHHRRSIRLKSHNYSNPGFYFITICTQHRTCLFGKIEHRKIFLNPAGELIQTFWQQLPQQFSNIALDSFILMPNHLHGIIQIQDKPTPTPKTIGDILAAFKSKTTHHYIIGVRQNHWPPFPGKLWQRNYYERVIRDNRELDHIRQYIQDNPLKWDEDPENPT